MIRKILAGLAVLLILAMAGVSMLIKTKGDVLLQKFSAYVEETTGAPLAMDGLPSLTFFPQPGLDLGRSSWGRKDGDLFVRFERASVRVSAKSLLMGRLDITDMEVDGLELTSRSAAGTPESAAQAAGQAAPVKSGEEEAPWDSARLEEMLTRILNAVPGALTVRDGHVSLIRPNGARLEFSHVDLTLEGVRPGEDTSLRLEAAVTGSQPDFSGALELNAEAALSDSSLTLTLRKAVFTPKEGLPVKAPLSLNGEGSYTLHDGLLTLRALDFSGPDASLALSGRVADLPGLARDPLHAAGPVSLDFEVKGSPRAVLSALKQPLALSDPGALSKAGLSGHLDFAAGVLKLGSLDGRLDDISLNGEIETRLEPLALSGDLRFGDVRLAPYLDSSGEAAKAEPRGGATRQGASAAKSGDSSGTDWQKSPELSLGLRVQSLELGNIRVEEIQTRLEGKNGIYTLNPLTCHAFGSPVTAAVEARLVTGGAAAADMTLNLSAPQIDLRQLSAALFPKLPLEGMANLNSTLACRTSNPVPTLSGRGSLSASPATVRMDILPPNVPGAAAMDGITRFDSAMLTFQAAKGVVTLTECALNGPRIKAEAKGEINLPGSTLDISGTVQVPGLAVLPVRLTGPLSAPSYRLNARTTIEAVDRTLKERGTSLEKEIQKGLGRLLRKK